MALGERVLSDETGVRICAHCSNVFPTQWEFCPRCKASVWQPDPLEAENERLRAELVFEREAAATVAGAQGAEIDRLKAAREAFKQAAIANSEDANAAHAERLRLDALCRDLQREVNAGRSLYDTYRSEAKAAFDEDAATIKDLQRQLREARQQALSNEGDLAFLGAPYLQRGPITQESVLTATEACLVVDAKEKADLKAWIGEAVRQAFAEEKRAALTAEVEPFRMETPRHVEGWLKQPACGVEGCDRPVSAMLNGVCWDHRFHHWMDGRLVDITAT